MSATGLTVTLRSPEFTATSEDASSLSVTTTMGPTIIYPKHASLVGTINFSQVVISGPNKAVDHYMVRNGLIYIDHEKNSVVISALFCDLISETNIDTVAEYLLQVESMLEKGKTLPPIQYTYLKNERLALIEQIKVLKSK